MIRKKQQCSLGKVALVTCAFAVLGFAPAPSHADTDDFEDTTSKYQTTFNWQRHPAFNNGGISPNNSLISKAESMYTFSATAHWGARVWKDGELYFNPEIVSGVPFSNNLVGLGSFTNGEITRAGGMDPKLYRQRLFLRQTWNQGGGTEKVESDFNQMAGTVDKNRIVLTAGNFSTLDVFDDNAYAKDPRTQFMNWGNWTYSSFDYAADARGYGWGFAVEWYLDDWVFKLGRMTGPKEPNGLAVDYQIAKHYGDQFEVERAHTIANRPGKARVLLWRDRANMASFSDALTYLNTYNPSDKETILQARNGDKTKYGLGFNVEQEISSNVGGFMRVMKTDGRTETYAFTEVDNSFSGGVLIKGGAWSRPEDNVGLSFMQNQLSNDRRKYLAAGGISFFIGDGSLSYKPENIFEGFYSFGIYKNTWLTADYQRISNPAYNSARGPVNVYAFRFHSEF
jgi:high affinity Mn2+ porin